MSDHDTLQTTMREHPVLDERSDLDERTEAFVDFLESEFPTWEFTLDTTSTWGGDDKPLWIATQEGHHPQSALTAAKLHRRLTDYQERSGAREALNN